ncbi:MAG: ATP-binding cassette domain-containing protein, partial [Lachnospiraceae bacterium]
MDILQIEDLTFTYPQADKSVLNHFSLNVKQGDFIVLCGVSGCGKTTLLRLIKKQLAPNGNTEGTICY